MSEVFLSQPITGSIQKPTQVSIQPNRQREMFKSYKRFEEDKLQRDRELFENEAEKLRSFDQQVKEMRQLISSFKGTAIQNLRTLEADQEKLRQEKEVHERAAQEIKKSNSLEEGKILSIKKRYLDICKERIGISNTINTDLFKKLELEDRKSQAHEIFKWAIITLYKEPVSKYYWENFCEQVFKEDKGHDFKERAGKISAAEIKEEERVATEAILKNREAVSKHPELAPAKTEVTKLLKIADLIMKGFGLTKELLVLEKTISERDFESKAKEEQAQKCVTRANAIKDRLSLGQKYITTLDDLDKSLSRKSAIYSMAADEGQKVIDDLRTTGTIVRTPSVHEYAGKQNTVPPLVITNTQNGQSEKVGQPSPQEPNAVGGGYNIEMQKRDECKCTVF